MAEQIRAKILFYIHHLYTADYIAFACAVVVLFLFLIFTILLRNKAFLALSTLILGFALSISLGIYGFKFIDTQLRARELTILNEQFLEASSSYVLDLSIKNLSNHDFTHCNISAKLFNKDTNANFIQKLRNKLVPLDIQNKNIESLAANESKTQRLSFANFNQDSQTSIILNSECF